MNGLYERINCYKDWGRSASHKLNVQSLRGIFVAVICATALLIAFRCFLLRVGI